MGAITLTALRSGHVYDKKITKDSIVIRSESDDGNFFHYCHQSQAATMEDRIR